MRKHDEITHWLQHHLARLIQGSLTPTFVAADARDATSTRCLLMTSVATSDATSADGHMVGVGGHVARKRSSSVVAAKGWGNGPSAVGGVLTR